MHRVIFRCAFLVLCTVSACAPLFSRPASPPAKGFPGWPAHFEERPLHALPMSDADTRFGAAFPGKIGRFTDGKREIILRWINTGTRKLHSSADCFRGLGYAIESAPALLDQAGARWSCFVAVRGADRLHVRERITSVGGESWTDVSAWFWSTLLHRSAGPWMAITTIERET